ncbi:MAG: hypothetical protein HJJLKODD_01041 [Phycisphaerae bacterium]|nr:hypothetical protein [Phycisphaerae bacterium]
MSRISCLLLVLALPAVPLHGQEGYGQPVQMSIIESQPINELLRKADEAIAQSDWKLAIDSLQRIIEEPASGVVPRDGNHYESARQNALRKLLEMPPEGLTAYRLLYDGQARRLLDQALADHDEQLLRRIGEQYLASSSGPTALITGAAWQLDIGHTGAALQALVQLEALLPEHPLNRITVPAMKALAYVQQGGWSQARRCLDALPGDAELEPAWRERIAQLRRYLDRPVQAPDAHNIIGSALRSWPIDGGGLQRQNVMPTVVPTFPDHSPWHYELPRTQQIRWSRLLEQIVAQGTYLATPMIADQHDLYFKCDEKIIVLDQLSLEPRGVWRPPGPSVQQSGGSHFDRPGWRFIQHHDGVDPELMETVAEVLEDHLAGQLSLAAGLLYDLQRDPTAEMFNFLQGMGSADEVECNRLVARDPEQDGRVLWYRGQSRDHRDPLNQALFTASPIAVARPAILPANGAVGPEVLLVPYWVGRDYFLGVLQPEDGNLLRSLHIGTLASGWLDSRAARPLAVRDQTAYLPTGAGLVAAVDLYDLSLRWLSRYPIAESTPQWLPAPPVITGESLLLPATDSAYLQAFSLVDGRLLWKVDRGRHSHIIAADDDSVYLGGEIISRLALEDGHEFWKLEVEQATGPAVLSGSNIYVPTRRSLIVIDSNSGKIVREFPTDGDEEPLGQLLCFNGALFSLDYRQLRKYPDLEQSYGPAQEAYTRQPDNFDALLRLAWLEVWRGTPQTAQTLIDQFPATSQLTPQQHSYLNRLRIQTLIARAQQTESTAEQRLTLLQQAVSEALEGRDRFQALGALLDFLVEQQNPLEAYRQGWQAYRRGGLDFLVAISPTHKRTARDLLAERLGQLRTSLSSDQQQTLAAELTQQLPTPLDPPPTGENRWTLWREWDELARGDNLAGLTTRAARELAVWNLQRKQYEKAEYYLRQMRRDGTPAQQLEAAVLAARMFAQNDLPAPQLADDWMKLLAADTSGSLLENKTGPQWAEQLGETLRHAATEIARRHQPAQDSQLQQLAGMMLSGTGGQLLTWPDQSTAATDLILTFSLPNRLAAYWPGDAALAWETELRLLEESSPENFSAISDVPMQYQTARAAKLQGQFMLLNTATGLHAVGLITGRRQWSAPLNFPPDELPESASPNVYDMAEGDVVLLSGLYQLQCRRAVDGGLIWQGTLPQRRPDSVRVVKQRVVTIEESSQSVVVLDRRTGKLQHEFKFEAPYRPVIVDDDLLCVIEGHNTVAYRLFDGQPAWSVEYHTEPTLFTLAGDHFLVIGGGHGEVQVLDTRSGEALFWETLEFAEQGIREAALDGERLILMGHGERWNGSEQQLAAVDLNHKQVLWTQTELGLPVIPLHGLQPRDGKIALLNFLNLAAFTADDIKLLNVTGLATGKLIQLDTTTGRLCNPMQRLTLDSNHINLTGVAVLQHDRLALEAQEGVILMKLPEPQTDPQP